MSAPASRAAAPSSSPAPAPPPSPSRRSPPTPTRRSRSSSTFAAGGASDIVARVVGEQLAKKLGQAVIVDNRPGAGGSVGGSAVVQSPADGYTLMLSNSTPISIGPFALEKQPYDPLVDFTHIASIGSAPCVVMANPATRHQHHRRPRERGAQVGQLQFGSGGPASIGHIYGELMMRTMGIKMGTCRTAAARR